jgi:hypothetical protein
MICFYLRPVENLAAERNVYMNEAKGFDYIALEVLGDICWSA